MDAAGQPMNAKAPAVVVVEDSDEVAGRALALVLAAERRAIEERGIFTIALSGGSTPRRLYELLAKCDVASFERWKVFFGDERWVPADDPASNYRMAREALLDHVAIPPAQVYPVDTTAGTAEKGAFLYSLTLMRSVPSQSEHYPELDLVLLGLGADGHTASLFPGSTALAARPRDLAVATFAPSQDAWRVTITAHVINAAHRVAFLVSGSEKAEALSRLVDGDAADPPPAALVRGRGDGSVVVIADRDAAVRLRSSP